MDAYGPGWARCCLAWGGLCLGVVEAVAQVSCPLFAEESAPGSDEEVVGGLPSQVLAPSVLTVSPSSFEPSLLFQRNCSQLCFSLLFPDFLTQGVCRQMLRLARIPNSRCLAKPRTNRGKRNKGPQTHRAEFSGTAAAQTNAALAPGRPAASPPRMEGAGCDRVDAPTHTGGTDLESETGREGRNHQLNFLEANLV